ncbi:hypothetical protein LFREDSHE_35790 [Shewanella baltica]
MRFCGQFIRQFSTHQMNASKLWGNSFLAKRAARGLVKIGIVAPVTVGDIDVAVEPSGMLLLKK